MPGLLPARPPILDFSGMGGTDLLAHARELRATVRRWTGIPTCVGLGPTKTLAKLANWVANHDPERGGVCDFRDEATRRPVMAKIPVGEVWGVGPASAAKLEALGCRTAADLARLDHHLARQLLTVVGERIVFELRGLSCLPLEEVAPQRKGCAVTRNFAGRVEDLPTLQEAVAAHTTRLAENLRRHGLATDSLTVFFHTSTHDQGPQHGASRTVTLPEATAVTLALLHAARSAVAAIWRPGHRYSKAGVMTMGLIRADDAPRPLFDGLDRARSARLMTALDAVNARWGRGTLVPAAAGLKRPWATQFEHRSPRYTTCLDELPQARASDSPEPASTSVSGGRLRSGRQFLKPAIVGRDLLALLKHPRPLGVEAAHVGAEIADVGLEVLPEEVGVGFNIPRIAGQERSDGGRTAGRLCVERGNAPNERQEKGRKG